MNTMIDGQFNLVLEPPLATALSDNVVAILHELADHLQSLLKCDEANVIDLLTLPLTAGEKETLKTVLGEGEISAQLQSLGPSEIHETQLPGVWWVTHRNIEQQIIAEHVEICHLPAILASDTTDIRDGLEALQDQHL